MRSEFTAATLRVFQCAWHWRSGHNDTPLTLPRVLLALAEESESHAAQWLAQHGIDSAAIRQQWPELVYLEDGRPTTDFAFSAEVRQAIRSAESRLQELPQPLALATEHLLLGMLAVPSDVSTWLARQGIDDQTLESAIHGWHGHTPGPVEVEFELESSTLPANAVSRSAAPRRLETVAASVATLRILDAEANRAREGLRVVEDYVRFVLDDVHLTSRFKMLRHELTKLLSALPASQLFASRDTQADVGTQISLPSEQSRTDANAVLAANLKRLEESLRSLEEFSKTIEPGLAHGFEQLRYQVYTLERAVVVTRSSRERLQNARLYVLVDGRPTIAEFEGLVAALVEAGVHILQLRDKQLADRELLDRARRLRSVTHGTGTLFIMNDRPDLAALCQADGVHVGQEELPLKEARTIVGPRALVGLSTHSLEQARQAVLDGADYLGVGPTFPSSTKQFDRFAGLELLRAVGQEIRLPAFAIGGITLENLPQVRAAGFERVAVSAAICSANDPAAAARAFLEQLSQ